MMLLRLSGQTHMVVTLISQEVKRAGRSYGGIRNRTSDQDAENAQVKHTGASAFRTH